MKDESQIGTYEFRMCVPLPVNVLAHAAHKAGFSGHPEETIYLWLRAVIMNELGRVGLVPVVELTPDGGVRQVYPKGEADHE